MKGKDLMNTGFVMCSVLCLIFSLLAILFTVLKEKSSILISGFNTMPKEKRELYDTEKLCKDQRNSFLLWAFILGAGAVLSYFVSQYMAIIAFVIWLVLFLKDVHSDEEKAFEKYKK